MCLWLYTNIGVGIGRGYNQLTVETVVNYLSGPYSSDLLCRVNASTGESVDMDEPTSLINMQINTNTSIICPNFALMGPSSIRH